MSKIKLETYCGLSCATCEFLASGICGGCIVSGGKPFHGKCDVAECAVSKKRRFCGECADFPCDILKSYSYDPEHGDNGERIENCKTIKLALVAEAREGIDPVAYCGFSCDTKHCFLGQWCGTCRSSYNCCSFATISEGGVCPQVACCKEKGIDGCWECSELDSCKKGYFSNEERGEYACKAQAMYVRAHGKNAMVAKLEKMRTEHEDLAKYLNGFGNAEAAFQAMENA